MVEKLQGKYLVVFIFTDVPVYVTAFITFSLQILIYLTWQSFKMVDNRKHLSLDIYRKKYITHDD